MAAPLPHTLPSFACPSQQSMMNQLATFRSCVIAIKWCDNTGYSLLKYPIHGSFLPYPVLFLFSSQHLAKQLLSPVSWMRKPKFRKVKWFVKATPLVSGGASLPNIEPKLSTLDHPASLYYLLLNIASPNSCQKQRKIHYHITKLNTSRSQSAPSGCFWSLFEI